MSYKDELFVAAFKRLQRTAAKINRKNGFNSPDVLCEDFENFLLLKTASQGPASVYNQQQILIPAFRDARAGLKLALIVSEIGEALEAVRKNLGPDDHIPEFSTEEAEMADAVIRIMNYATDRKLRLAEAIVAKNEFNRDRADHTNRTGIHGKRF